MSPTIYNSPLTNYTPASDTISGVEYPYCKLDIGGVGVSSPVTAANPVPVTGTITATETSYATRIDEASATVSYVGKAATGSVTASAVWQVQKLDTTSGLIITWADSNASFDNVWDNRASLTYG